MIIQIIFPLKYARNFCRTLKMLLSNCEISLILTWSANYIISYAAANQATTFVITDTKLYVPVVTLLIDDNAKPIATTKIRIQMRK